MNYGSIFTEENSMLIDRIALALLIVGGLNWGSVGFFKFDIVAWIFGGAESIGARIVYVLVALCALWCVSLLFRERLPASEHND